MLGRQLRRSHRATMWETGGLVQIEDKHHKVHTRPTDKYQSLKPWLRSRRPYQIAVDAKAWLKRKRAAS
jgi:hypothetical protein